MSLLTDLYQVTMSQGYFHAGMHQRLAVFHLFFREEPFGGSYAIACGLSPALDFLESFKIDQDQVAYLSTLLGNDGERLLSDSFLEMIQNSPLQVRVDAIPEGSVVFANEPLLRVQGPLWQCQWLETAFLNLINFQTLIATKAARVCLAAKGDPVLEFGLRRAQGIDGGLSASRAAYIGGCAGTSNVQAGMKFGIPVKGTHAHSWVMCFDSELSAFEAYANALPNNCVFLVDTYDTLEGVRNAIKIGQWLRQQGREMIGIRLDSGDLATLSQKSRKLLDAAGFRDAVIVASNDLDEGQIERLKQNGATIAVWGVGTNLVTAKDQPALGGVYKLAALQDEQGTWIPKIKLSEQPIKTSVPGIQQVRRFSQNGQFVRDVVFNELIGPPEQTDGGQEDDGQEYEDLLQTVFQGDRRTSPVEEIQVVRQRVQKQLTGLTPGQLRLRGPESYRVELEKRLAAERRSLIADLSTQDLISGR